MRRERLGSMIALGIVFTAEAATLGFSTAAAGHYSDEISTTQACEGVRQDTWHDPAQLGCALTQLYQPTDTLPIPNDLKSLLRSIEVQAAAVASPPLSRLGASTPAEKLTGINIFELTVGISTSIGMATLAYRRWLKS